MPKIRPDRRAKVPTDVVGVVSGKFWVEGPAALPTTLVVPWVADIVARFPEGTDGRLMSLPAVEDVIRTVVFVLLAIFVLANTTLILLFTEVGLTTLFVMAFAFVIALFAGAALLAVNVLYPQAVTFTDFTNLLLLVLSTSLVSTLLLLWSEKTVAGVSRRSGLDRSWVEIGSVAVCGVVAALLMALGARFEPDIELTLGAALAASLVGVFAFYRAEDPGARILALTASVERGDVLRALREKAAGYVLKDDPTDRFVHAIHAVADGGSYLSPGPNTLRNRAEPWDDVDERDRLILRMVAEGKRNAEIARELHIAERTAKHHLSRICRTLNAENRTMAAAIAIEHGIIGHSG